jgi:hypothetical protein
MRVVAVDTGQGLFALGAALTAQQSIRLKSVRLVGFNGVEIDITCVSMAPSTQFV